MDRLPETALQPTIGRIGRRERAVRLAERMLAFSSVYQAAWLVRDSWHGRPERQAECINKMAEAVKTELERTSDREALLYAIADALYCSPLGVPWEA